MTLGLSSFVHHFTALMIGVIVGLLIYVKDIKRMITINIYYKGKNGNAKKFAEEMVQSGTADKIREKDGNVKYEYFFPMYDEETVLLIDSWKDQQAIDEHHFSPMMKVITDLRDKYDLHMTVERYISDDLNESIDQEYIRK